MGLNEDRRFFARFVEDVKEANPRKSRTEIIAFAVKLFGISESEIGLLFRKCVFCDSWEVRQHDGYCFNCSAYTGWYDKAGLVSDESDAPSPSASPGEGAARRVALHPVPTDDHNCPPGSSHAGGG